MLPREQAIAAIKKAPSQCLARGRDLSDGNDPIRKAQHCRGSSGLGPGSLHPVWPVRGRVPAQRHLREIFRREPPEWRTGRVNNTRMGAPEQRKQALIRSQVAASLGTTDAQDMRGFQAGNQSINYNNSKVRENCRGSLCGERRLADIYWQETFDNRMCVAQFIAAFEYRRHARRRYVWS